MSNLPGCIVLLPGIAKVFQIRKILRFDKSDTDILDLIIEDLIEIKYVRNYILNTLSSLSKFSPLYFPKALGISAVYVGRVIVSS